VLRAKGVVDYQWTGPNGNVVNSPSYIIKLNEIKELGVLLEERNSKWFFKRG
jgi:hypothetical protein